MRILLADDCLEELTAARQLMERLGHSVVMTACGHEAMSLVHVEPPDVVLVDLGLPGQNGFQISRAISKNAKTWHIPVVLLLGEDREADRFWGARQGAFDFLTKPLEPSHLERVLGFAHEEVRLWASVNGTA